MSLKIVELIVGLAIAGVTLADVFDTIVVPGAPRGWLRVAERVRRLSLPIWRRSSRTPRGTPRIARGYASFILVAAFVVWMLTLLLGFGLADHALGAFYRPPVQDFAQALYTAGAALLTLGLTGQNVQGPGRWLVLTTGLCGLAVMTMAITYIIQLQSGLHQRDWPIVQLSAVSGRPPSGIVLLETYADVGCRAELGRLFRGWRDWSAAVHHSHYAHPVLAYFDSLGTGLDWPAALGAVLDAASITVALVHADATGPAKLLHGDGSRMAADMLRIFDLQPGTEPEVSAEAVTRLQARLDAAGYAVRRDAEAGDRLGRLRQAYAPALDAIASYLGADRLVLEARPSPDLAKAT